MIKREAVQVYETQGGQGDVYFVRVDRVPDGFAALPRDKPLVLAHSESGHDHVVDPTEAILYEGSDPLVAYLVLDSDVANVHHQKTYDYHHTDGLGGGVGAVWQVRRQREYDPAGDRRAAD